jgi:hypothetical protein
MISGFSWASERQGLKLVPAPKLHARRILLPCSASPLSWVSFLFSLFLLSVLPSQETVIPLTNTKTNKLLVLVVAMLEIFAPVLTAAPPFYASLTGDQRKKSVTNSIA